jgi:hypothetical protein
MTPTTTTYVFPETLQALLKDTVHAIQAIQADPRYELNMVFWHTPSSNGRVCHVCVAGAWMAHNLIKNPMSDDVFRSDNMASLFGENRERTHSLAKLLNFLRLRDLKFLETIGIDTSKLPEAYNDCCVSQVIEFFTYLEKELRDQKPILLSRLPYYRNYC